MYTYKKDHKKKYTITDDGIKFFSLNENEKIIKIKPPDQVLNENSQRKVDKYEIYKLPKYKEKQNLQKK